MPKPYICNHCLAIHDGELGECLEAYIASLKVSPPGEAKEGAFLKVGPGIESSFRPTEQAKSELSKLPLSTC